ncbi:Outer membrane protein assembly factor BamB, contains PQQ-like beta-propeller repeat [Clostridium cavendishii DSM 21758]|uniref:Outer membrane protein assembly factor BamB, contains PQQ-like beta-propeller repeat n=1 Tax=Clostridium cavendishii DSM 21758 TaxID=1121302 RepID=A0A1M6GWV7_9CLOT|nr:PQQ-binding-like beta-propeller repeat protein [Clostridium cavendishii]SHJ14390.1 Outer membrane protein assembly factor BamB, contains PQQ-like beta-propeller repeat [Clostridium cavendishii DSM 21758]
MKNLLGKMSILVLSFVAILFLQGCSKDSSKDILWSFKTDAAIMSSPVILDNNIIFGNNAKTVYSVDLKTHEEKWKFKTDNIINSDIVISEKNVIVSTPNTCYLLDASTGKEIWHYTSKLDVKERIDTYDYHSPAAVNYKDLIIFTSKAGTIYGINKTDGKLVWEYKESNCSEITTTPSLQGDVLCFGDSKGNCFAMDLNTQKTILNKSMGSKMVHASFIYKDYVYFSGRDAKMVAYSLKDGSEKWSFSDEEGSWLTADMIVKDDIIYVGGSDNHKVYSFKYDSGDKVSKFIGTVSIFSKPVIKDNILYFADGDVYSSSSGHIFGYDINNDKKKVFEFEVKKPIYTTPIIVDDTIYFGSTDGSLYAIKATTK